MTNRIFTIAITAIAALSMGACSSLPLAKKSDPKVTDTQPDLAAEAAPVASRPFTGDTLYDLLLAEFAGKRNRADVALGKYLKQAHETRDPLVVERATFIARFLGAHQATMDAAMLWSEIEPDNPKPRELIATELIRSGKLDLAMLEIDQLLADQGSLNFEYLLKAARNADQPTQEFVLNKLREYSQTVDNDQLWFTKGALEAMAGNQQTAIDDYDAALRLKPGYSGAILAKTQALMALEKQDEALDYLRQQSNKYPEDKRLGVVYARYLIKMERLADAEDQFTRLAENFPNDGDLHLSLALLSWENNNPAAAKEHFNTLLQMQHRTDEANVYLARIALSEQDYPTAIKHFQQVNQGPQYVSAQVLLASAYSKSDDLPAALEVLDNAMAALPEQRIQLQITKSEILAQHDDNSGAIKILDQVLVEDSGNISALYNRAMLKERVNDFTGMEADLRQLLQLEPDNSAALNALGYTFADRNHRLSEAWELIERAYELNPEDPAIIDSMGWIKYRMGDNREALSYLRRAYAAFADQEIAAHLGEVLWILGEQEEAKNIWQDSLRQNPDSKLLQEVMQRFLPPQ